MKKIISCLLIFVLLLSSACILVVSAAGENEYTQGSIQVGRRGDQVTVTVFVNKKGTVLVPVDCLVYCGGMYQTSNNSEYIFYHADQGATYQKQIRINKNGKSGKSVLCISSSKTVTITSTTFSDSYSHKTGLYLPLAELLPFLDAKVEITTDGVLHIVANPVSFFSVLTYDDLDSLAFDADEIFGSTFVGATGMILDSIVNFRFDRLDFITGSGAIKDYSKLFKSYLVDDEVYLSAFDKEQTPFQEALNMSADAFDDFNDAVEKIDDTKKPFEALYYLINSKKFDSAELSDAFENFDELVDVIDGVTKVIEFTNAYINQVEDHRDMLYAVYGGKYYSVTARCKAANETAQLFGKNTSGQLLSAGTSALRDYLAKAGKGAITNNTAFLPYKIAFAVTGVVYPKMEETLANAANTFYMDDIVSDSCSVFNDRLDNIKFDEASLKDLRLSLMMSLISSKCAYETYFCELSEDDNFSNVTPDSVECKQLSINEWLTRVYLSADSVECSTPQYYKTTKAELTNSSKYLKVTIAHTHSYGSWKVTTNPTCTKAGEKTHACDCGEKEIVLVEPEGHNLVTLTVPSTCCTYGYTYTYCINEYCDLIPHTVYVKNGTSYYVAVADEQGVMQPVRLLGVEPHNTLKPTHNFVLDKVQQATSTQPGNKTYICKDCSLIQNETIPPLGDSPVSQGLEFTLNSDGKSYSVTGIGTCTDADVVIPTKYNDMPVTNIAEGAFYDCLQLKSIFIPNSVTTIEVNVGIGCTNLTSITISNSVTNIGNRSFTNTPNLENILVNAGNPVYHSSMNCLIETTSKTLVLGCKTSVIPTDGSVANIGEGAFSNCSSLISIRIPDGVTVIDSNAFMSCTNLNNVTMPNGIIRIGMQAFFNCSSLTSINIPKSVTSIGMNTFALCSSLTSISIPNGVESIGKQAFSNCSNLTSITISDSLKGIKSAAFAYCDALKDVYYVGTEVEWNAITIDIRNECLTNATIHFESVSDDSLASEGLEFTLNSDGKSYSVTGIGTCADKDIVIPKTYNGLEVTEIGYKSFYNCSNIISITIPSSVTSISANALNSIINLESIYVSDDNPVFHSAGNCLISGKILIAGCKSSIIPSDGSVISIGFHAFYGCSGLTSIIVPDSVKTIGDAAFYGCTKLTSITIPSSVTQIGPAAFGGCSSLKNIVIPESVTELWGENLFEDCKKLESIELPSSINYIGNDMFNGCSSLTSINIPQEVAYIGYNAFRGCSSLMNIQIPDSVKTIGDAAFYGCTRLTSITIPSGVTQIYPKTFYSCKALKDVYYTGTETKWTAIAIESGNDCLKNATIHFNSKN